MDIKDLTPEQREEAERAVKLVSDAWSLRARLVDDRGIRIGWNVGRAACDALRKMGPDMVGLGDNSVRVEHDGTVLLVGYEVRADGGLPEWGIVLSMAPGDES